MRASRTLWTIAGAVLAPLAVFVLTGGGEEGLRRSEMRDLSRAGTTTAPADANMAQPGQRGPQLTDEQQAALTALQEALDAGEITQEEFCQQVHDVVGDPPCDEVQLPPGDLTEEQRAQAEAIFQDAHDQLVALHAAAREQVLGLLTEEQQQALAELEQPPAPPDANEAQPEPLCPLQENSACAQPAQVPLAPCPEQQGEQPGGPENGGPPQDGAGMAPPQGGPPSGQPSMERGQDGPPAVCLSEETVAALALTDEQVAAIEAIHTALDTATSEVRDAAQEAFQALLMDEQSQESDQPPPPPPSDGPRPPR